MALSMALRLGDGGSIGRALVQGQLVLDLLVLGHVERKVDQHRPRPSRASDAEGLAEHPGDLGRLLDLHRPLGDRLGDLGDVDGLEGLLVQQVGGRLAGDADDRDGVGPGRVEAGDHVRPGRSRGADADADAPGDPGQRVGGVGAALLVAHDDVLDLPRTCSGPGRGGGSPPRGCRRRTRPEQHGQVGAEAHGALLLCQRRSVIPRRVAPAGPRAGTSPGGRVRGRPGRERRRGLVRA